MFLHFFVHFLYSFPHPSLWHCLNCSMIAVKLKGNTLFSFFCFRNIFLVNCSLVSLYYVNLYLSILLFFLLVVLDGGPNRFCARCQNNHCSHIMIFPHQACFRIKDRNGKTAQWINGQPVLRWRTIESAQFFSNNKDADWH